MKQCQGTNWFHCIRVNDYANQFERTRVAFPIGSLIRIDRHSLVTTTVFPVDYWQDSTDSHCLGIYVTGLTAMLTTS